MITFRNGAFLVALLALIASIIFRHDVTHFIFWVLGNRDEPGAWYGFWSGFAGGLQVFQWFALGLLLYWHHTCHASAACLRLGKYDAAGGVFKLCHKHHPDLNGERPHLKLIHDLHRKHKNGSLG